MARKRKPTRKQKQKMNPHGKGNSKYALKVARRKKAARRAGFNSDTPYPIINGDLEPMRHLWED